MDVTVPSPEIVQIPGFVGNSLRPQASSSLCVVSDPFPPDLPSRTNERYACIYDPDNCSYGLSVSIWVKFADGELSMDDRKVLIGTDNQGFKIWRNGRRLGAEIWTKDKYWDVEYNLANYKRDYNRDLTSNRWINVGFRWNKVPDGMQLMVDGFNTGKDSSYRPGSDVTRTAAPTRIYVGCEAGNTSGSIVSVVSSLLDEAAIFTRRVRDREIVIMTGGYLFRADDLIPKTTTPSPDLNPTQPPPLYDYAAKMDLLLPLSSQENVCYRIADRFWSLNDSSLATLSTRGAVLQENGQGGKQSSIKFGDANAQIKLDNIPACLGDMESCITRGFAFSIWLFFPSSVAPAADREYVLVQADFVGPTGWAFVYKNGQILVKVSKTPSDAQIFSIPISLTPRDIWLNIGLSWYQKALPGGISVVTDVYVNGVNARAKSDVYTTTPIGNDRNKGDVTIGSSGQSLVGMAASDVAYFDRYLFDVESHKLMGITAGEFVNFVKFVGLWTTNEYIYSDELSRRIYKLNTVASFSRIQGHDPLRGSAVEIATIDDADTWLLLGATRQTVDIDQDVGKMVGDLVCFSDPSLCLYGITITMWFKLHTYDYSSPSYLFSTGEQDYESRGISIYLYNYRFYLGVVDNERIWKVTLPKSQVPVDTWCHLVASWSPDNGIWIAINGTVLSYNEVGAADPRDTDLLTRATLGRTNREAVFMGFARYAFETLTLNDSYLETNVFRQQLNLIDNAIYAKADYFWDNRKMIASDLPLLLNYTSLGGRPLGPFGSGIEPTPKWVSVMNTQADFVNLGVFEDNCICNPDLCTEGLTVAVWSRYNNTAQPSDIYIIACHPVSGVIRDYPGMQLAINVGNKVSATVRTKTKKWNAISSKEQILTTWFNLGFAWSQTDGLVLYFNGERLAVDKDGTTISTPLVSTTMNLLICFGDGANLMLDYYRVVAWRSFTYDSKAAQMMGLTALQEILFRNDYYWPFDGIVDDLDLLNMVNGTLKIRPTLYGADWVRDQSITGRAIRTTKRRQGWVSLGDHTNGCIVNPKKCMTMLVVSLNVYLERGNDGTLLSSGAQTPGMKGVYIHQFANDSLKFIVADGDNVFTQITNDFKFDKWFQIVVSWSSTKLSLTVGGEVPLIQYEEKRTEARANQSTTVTLGRQNDQNVGFINAQFDEISFKYYEAAGQSTPDADVIKRGGCYDTPSMMFYLDDGDTAITKQGATPSNDRFGEDMALQTDGTGYILLGSFTSTCLSDPELCASTGMALSLWFKLLPNSPPTGDIFSSGPLTTRGFLIQLLSDRKVQFVVQSATARWQVSGVSIGTDNNWVNLALVWKKSTGLVVYVNGTQSGADSASTPNVQASDQFADAFLGKSNINTGGNQLSAAYDDVAFWTVSPDTSDQLASILMGVCFDAVAKADANAFTRPPPTTAAPTTPWSPPAGVQCGSWTADRVCMTPSDEALKIMADTPYQYTPDSCRILNDVVNSASLSAKSASALESLVKLNAKIAASPPPTVVETDDLVREAQKLVESTSNIIDLTNSDELKKISAINVTETVLTSMENFVTQWTANLSPALADNCTVINLDSKNIIVSTAKYRLSRCKATQGFTFPDYSSTTIKNRVQEWVGDDPKNQYGMDQLELDLSTAFDHVPTSGSERFSGQVYGALFKSVYAAVPPVKNAGDPKLANNEIIVNSNVMTMSILPKRPSERPFVSGTLKFHLAHKVDNVYLKRRTEFNVSVFCSFLDEDALEMGLAVWSTRGCQMINTTKFRSTCSCNHLTNFGVLMQQLPTQQKSTFEIIQSVVMYSCLILSITCLTVLFLCIVVHSDLITERNVVHMNLAISMAFGNVAFLFNEIAMPDVYACRAVGLFVHYFYTAAYCWLFVESLYVFYAITSGLLRGRLRCYLPLCWGLPLVLVAATAGTNISAYGWERYCWPTPVNNFVYAFIGPIMLLIVLTTIVLMIIICNLPTPAIKKEEILRELRRLTRDSLLLIIVLYVTWILATVIIWNESEALLMCFTVTFCLQGFFMFLTIVSGSSDVRRHLICLPCCRKRAIGARKFSTESFVKTDIANEKTEIFYMAPMASTSKEPDNDGSGKSDDIPPPRRRSAASSGSQPSTASGTHRSRSPPPVCKSSPPLSSVSRPPPAYNP